MGEKQYSSDELNQFEILTDDLIKWTFNIPNDRHPIIEQIKKAYNLGEEKEREFLFKKLRKIMKTRFNMKEKYIEELLNLIIEK